jgi:nitrogen fixation/metabolism regulation signal transduction histidine kinase
MVYKNFRLNVIFRVLLLAGTIFLFFYLFYNTEFVITLTITGILALLQIWGLIHYVDRTNRVINSFLESIRYSDFSRTFQVDDSSSSFGKLKQSFNEVIKNFQKVKAEKEESYFYLQSVIQHIGIALIAYRRDGSVEMINNTTKKLFQVSSLSNISELEKVSPELVEKLLSVKHGENTLLRIQDKDDILQLAIYATEFTIRDRTIILTSIKNIQAELEEKEMESWQKLIRVLTHEIMNSITPISSLSSTVTLIIDDLKETLKEKGADEDILDSVDDVENAFQTIHKRTDGLLHFVNTYRNLTTVPQPQLTIFSVKELFDNIKKLHEEQLGGSNISCEIDVHPETLELTADEKLIEQVLINLLKNSMQALADKDGARIILKGFINKRGRVTLQVIDNGTGILPDVLDKIFIPFFTTKADGSGIGLSLSKQIMRKHGGNLSAYSEPNKETIFTLTF